MSYDLYFKSRNGDFDKADFAKYFGARKFYEMTGQQAWYENEATGVYFCFEFAEKVDQGDEFEYSVSFNMNFIRPSFFIEEAELEIANFVATFDLLVIDPQVDGLGDGDFNALSFRTGWQKGNLAGIKFTVGESEVLNCLPEQLLTSDWRWNFRLEEFQETLGDAIFVPKIVYMLDQGDVKRAVVWTDGIPVILPKVDILIIHRDRLAPRKLFRKRAGISIAHWDSIEPIVRKHQTGRREEAIELGYSEVPAEIAKMLKALEPVETERLTLVPPDRVLDLESVTNSQN